MLLLYNVQSNMLETDTILKNNKGCFKKKPTWYSVTLSRTVITKRNIFARLRQSYDNWLVYGLFREQ